MKLKRLQSDWDELGRRDPLWAVLTAPEKRGNRWDEAEFFATGVQAVEGILRHFESLGLTFGRGKALDFGCGVGRLTQALAEHFDEVHGVDIAPSMIELARSHNRCGDRCTYHVNDRDDLALFEDGAFDFVLSLITLQHMPPAHATSYLREFVRVLAPGGVMVVQTAGEQIVHSPGGLRGLLRRAAPAPLLRAYRRLRQGHAIDMYGINREEVVELLEANGASVVDVAEDPSAGASWTSFLYCARKG